MFDMIGNIFKNLSSKPATRVYPKQKREPFDRARGKVCIHIDTCIFCGICSRKCPSDAIKVNKAEKSWEVDPFKCVVCGACEDACPKKSIYMDGAYKAPAYNKENVKHVQEAKPEKTGSQESA